MGPKDFSIHSFRARERLKGKGRERDWQGREERESGWKGREEREIESGWKGSERAAEREAKWETLKGKEERKRL